MSNTPIVSIPARKLTKIEARELCTTIQTLNLSAPPNKVQFSPELDALRCEILEHIERQGVCILENLLDVSNESTFALMALVGRPGADADEEDTGPLIMDLKPMPREDAEQISSYYTWNEFDFHTDLAYTDTPPDYITVTCVQPDPEGQGLSLFSDIVDCVRTMPSEITASLQKPLFNIATPPRCISQQVHRPLLTKDSQGRWRLRVRFDKVSSDCEEGTVALNELHNALERHRTATLLPKNSAYVCDNHRVVHGRTPFKFHNDGTDRHLKRIYGMRRE